MKKVIYRYFNWILIGLGLIAWIFAAQFVGQDSHLFKLYLLLSGLLTFAATTGFIVTTATR